MKRYVVVLIGLLVLSLSGLGTGNAESVNEIDRRTVLYHQTMFNNGEYVSPLPLVTNGTGITHLIVGAIHLDANSVVHLNDDPPENIKFDQLWDDLATLRDLNVPVLAFVGGAAPGSFNRLEHQFDTYYPLLRDFLKKYDMSGVDLDVEEPMSNNAMIRLIDALRADFGSNFLITLAPVATELSGGGGLSRLDYDQLYRDRGNQISWFNTQFYCGWGNLTSTVGYDKIVNRHVVPAGKVVAGTVTNPRNCGGYVDMLTLKSTLRDLSSKYDDFGGVMGWEYFNSLPGDTAAPWKWAVEVSSSMNSGTPPTVTSRPGETDILENLWGS